VVEQKKKSKRGAKIQTTEKAPCEGEDAWGKLNEGDILNPEGKGGKQKTPQGEVGDSTSEGGGRLMGEPRPRKEKRF